MTKSNMRDKIEEVGIHFSKRRSNRDKLRFMNRLASRLKAAGRALQMIEAGDRHVQSHHLVCGDLKKSRIVFLAAYDTGSRMLNPGYRYTPLDSRRNLREEMKNIAGYSVMTLDAAVLLLVFRWMKKPDNKMNMNRNSGGTAVLYACAEDTSRGCFVFVDNGVMSNQGFYETAEHLENREAVVLDSIAGTGTLFLACREEQVKRAEEMASAFDCEIRVLPLGEEQYQNTPLEGFPNGYMLTAGEERNGTVYVRHARRPSDMDLNVERMEKIRDGILKLI